MVNEAATGIQGNRSRVADDRQSEIRLALRPFPSRYRRTFMDIEEPHGPPHESSSFWYDTEQKALLFEVIFRDKGFTPEADHSHGQAERARRGNHWHDHLNPHGVKLADSSMTDPQGNDATRNIELIIRLWNQVINGEQIGRPERGQRFLPVPTTLALFLNGRRDQMHESDSITQALILLQTHAANPAERSIQDQS